MACGRTSQKGQPNQSPVPGLGEKYCSLPGTPSQALESAGGVFLVVIFGQVLEYSALSDSHFSSPGSVSGLIASTGHSGSHTPQSMHSSGWMTSIFSLVEAIHGAHSDAVHGFAANAALIDDIGQ